MLSTIGRPAQVVAWSDDALHPLVLAERVSEALGGDLATVPPLPAIFIEPELIGRTYRHWLERRGPGRGPTL